VQALLMLNRIKECIPYLQQLIDNNYFPEVARQYLPRLYYSSGELEAFDKAIKYRPEKFDEYQRAWHLLADEDAARRKLQYEAQAQLRKQAARDKKEKDKEPVEEAAPVKRDKKSNQPLGFGPVGKPLFYDDGKTSADG
jgi:hypothetical protein